MKNLQLGDFCLSKEKGMAQEVRMGDINRAQQETNQIRKQYDDLVSRHNDLQSEVFSLRLQIDELTRLIPHSTLSSLPSYAQVIKDKNSPVLTPLRKKVPISPVVKTRISNNVKFSASTAVRASTPSSTPTLTAPPTGSTFPSPNTNFTQFPISSVASSPFPFQPKSFPQPPSSLLRQTINSNSKKSRATSDMKTSTSIPIPGSSSISTPNPTPPPKINTFPLRTPSKTHSPPPPSFQEQTATVPSDVLRNSLPPSKWTSRQTNVPEKVPVQIYHDSNLAWSGPNAINDAIKRVFPKQSEEKDFNVSMSLTPKLEDVLQAVTQTNHANSVVIIAVMTNNAKQCQPVERTHSILQRIVDSLKRQTSPENIIIIESPPSLQFDIYPYNRASYHLCCSSGVHFSLSQLETCHIKDDGLHIKNSYKHLMIKSVVAAIMKINPYIHFGLIPPVKRPWIIAPRVNFFMMRTYPCHFQHHFLHTT